MICCHAVDGFGNHCETCVFHGSVFQTIGVGGGFELLGCMRVVACMQSNGTNVVAGVVVLEAGLI